MNGIQIALHSTPYRGWREGRDEGCMLCVYQQLCKIRSTQRNYSHCHGVFNSLS